MVATMQREPTTVFTVKSEERVSAVAWLFGVVGPTSNAIELVCAGLTEL